MDDLACALPGGQEMHGITLTAARRAAVRGGRDERTEESCPPHSRLVMLNMARNMAAHDCDNSPHRTRPSERLRPSLADPNMRLPHRNGAHASNRCANHVSHQRVNVLTNR